MKNKLVGFLAGAAVGAGVAVAISKYLSSESGKKTKKNIEKMWISFYDFIEPRLKMAKNVTKAKYRDIINVAADEFGRSRDISEDMVKELKKKTMNMWENFMEEDNDDEEDKEK